MVYCTHSDNDHVQGYFGRNSLVTIIFTCVVQLMITRALIQTILIQSHYYLRIYFPASVVCGVWVADEDGRLASGVLMDGVEWTRLQSMSHALLYRTTQTAAKLIFDIIEYKFHCRVALIYIRTISMKKNPIKRSILITLWFSPNLHNIA